MSSIYFVVLVVIIYIFSYVFKFVHSLPLPIQANIFWTLFLHPCEVR